ncbi:MAG: CoA transferase [Acidimicrobiia bacterium]|nr:CoA transferase [Acidimicrobiia bacterium]
MMSPILEGIRVIDAATYIAAPSAAAILADFGADVIKIERPPHGDPFRYLHQVSGMPDCDVAYQWIMDNRNKRSLALDLARGAGRGVLMRLVERADVFLTNYQPALIRKFGLGWEELRAVNARLIYASVTGYGETGADADKPGYDMTAYYARSGLMDFIHNAGSDPALSPCGFGDHPTAMSLFGGIMLALYRRLQTGQGGKVSTTLMANGVWANASLIQGALCGASFRERRHRRHPHNPLVNHYQARDGRRFLFCLLDPVKDWARLCRAMEREDLIEDTLFATPAARRENSAELVKLLDAVFEARDMVDWEARFAAQDVLYAPVAVTRELADDPALWEQKIIRQFAGGSSRTIANPIRFDGTESAPPRSAPEIGAHTNEILAELGYCEEEAAELCGSGIAVQAGVASKNEA